MHKKVGQLQFQISNFRLNQETLQTCYAERIEHSVNNKPVVGLLGSWIIEHE